MIVNRYISVENFLRNSVPVACGKLIAARYTARHCRQRDSLQASQVRLMGRCHWEDIFCATYSPTLRHCWMLRVESVCTPCWMLLDVVTCRCAKFETCQTFQPTTPNISFVLWSPNRSATTVGSVWTARPTLLGPRTGITHGLQRLMGCILPTMHCRSQHCWELLHPFGHHCQHARNNFQHCWRNNVGSCFVRLHAALPLIPISTIYIQYSFKEFLRIKPPLCSSVKCLYGNASLPSPCQRHLLRTS